MKTNNKQQKQAQNWNKIEFVNRNLDADEGEKFKVWAKGVDNESGTLISEIMVDDYKLSVTYDDNNECFIATITGKDEQRHNPNKALSARSDNWYEAVMMALYKHLVLFGGGKWSGGTQRNNWG